MRVCLLFWTRMHGTRPSRGLSPTLKCGAGMIVMLLAHARGPRLPHRGAMPQRPNLV
jgi:hypothetical protein